MSELQCVISLCSYIFCPLTVTQLADTLLLCLLILNRNSVWTSNLTLLHVSLICMPDSCCLITVFDLPLHPSVCLTSSFSHLPIFIQISHAPTLSFNPSIYTPALLCLCIDFINSSLYVFQSWSTVWISSYTRGRCRMHTGAPSPPTPPTGQTLM